MRPASVREGDFRLLLRPAEAAGALGISRAKCYALINAGEVPSIRLGGSIRVPVAQLQSFIDARLAKGADVG